MLSANSPVLFRNVVVTISERFGKATTCSFRIWLMSRRPSQTTTAPSYPCGTIRADRSASPSTRCRRRIVGMGQSVYTPVSLVRPTNLDGTKPRIQTARILDFVSLLRRLDTRQRLPVRRDRGHLALMRTLEPLAKVVLATFRHATAPIRGER
jgi:hypothetical protein